MAVTNDVISRLEDIKRKLTEIRSEFSQLGGQGLDINMSGLERSLSLVDELFTKIQSTPATGFQSIESEVDNSIASLNRFASAYDTALNQINNKRKEMSGPLTTPLDSVEAKDLAALSRINQIIPFSYQNKQGETLNPDQIQQRVNAMELPTAQLDKFTASALDTEIEIRRIQSSLTELYGAFGRSKGITDLNSALEKVRRNMSMTGQDVRSLNAAMGNLLKDQQAYTSQPMSFEKANVVTEQVKQTIRDTGLLMNRMGQGFTMGYDYEKVEPGKPKVEASLTGDWQAASRMIDEVSQSQGNLDDILEKSVRGIAKFVEETQGAATRVLPNYRAEINGTTGELELLFTTLKKTDNLTSLRRGRASVDFRTGEVQSVDTPSMKATGAAPLDFIRNNADYVKNLYGSVNQEVLKMQQELQSQGNVQIFDEQTKINVDEVTGSVEILLSYLDRSSDEAAVLRKEFASLRAQRADDDSVTFEPPRSSFEASKDLFSGSQAQAEYIKNFNEALKGTNLTAQNFSTATKDAASGLINISASAQSATGVTERLNLVFDKNGQLVTVLNDRYGNFSRSLGHSVTTVLRYAIAARLVYSAFNRIQEIPGIMADLDKSMSRLTAVTSLSREGAENFFNTAVSLSRKYGFELEEVLAASEKALQASGPSNTADAAILLGDAMLYAELSGEDLNESLDDVIAALSQLGMELTEGQTLLSKWIVLSQQLGVNITALSDVYSSVGSLATEVLSADTGEAIDELNALITVMEKSTSLNPDQISSFFKTSFSSFTSPEVISSLKSYGIEVKDSAGNLRDLYDVMREINSLTVRYEATTSGSLSAISTKVGRGGSRQAAEFTTLIKNWQQVEEARQVSENAAINYAEFVGELTDNLRNDISGLSLAFSELLTTLGEAGMMDIISNIVNSVSALTEVLSDFTDQLGESGSQVLLFIPTMLALQKVMGMAFKGITGVEGGEMTNFGVGLTSGISSALTSKLSGDETEIAIAKGLASALAGGLAAAVGGPVVGMAVGQMVTTLATLIQAEIKQTNLFKDLFADEDIAGMLQESGALNVRDTGIFGERSATRIDQMQQQRLAEAAGRATGLDRQVIQALPAIYQNNLDAQGPVGEASRLYQELNKALQEETAVRSDVIQGLETMNVNLGESRTAERLSQISFGHESFRTFTESPEYATQSERLRKQAFDMFAVDETLSRRDYSAITEPGGILSEAAPIRAQKAWDNFAQEFQKIGMDFYDVMEIFAFSGNEISEYVGGQVAELSNLKTNVEENEDAAAEYEKRWAEVWQLIQLANREVLQMTTADLELPGFIDWRDTTAQQRQAAVENGKAYLDAFVETLGWTKDEYAAWLETLDPVYLRVDDAAFEELEEKIPQQFLELGMEASDSFDEGFNIRRLPELGTEDVGKMESLNNYWLEYIAAIKGMNKQQYLESEGETFNMVLGPENVLHPMQSTVEAINFVLQDILETEKKQLEGMWNIPDGATFWVPLTSLFYQDRDKDERYLPEVEELSDAGNNLNYAGDKLITAADTMTKYESDERIRDVDIPSSERILDAYLPLLLKGFNGETIPYQGDPEESPVEWFKKMAEFRFEKPGTAPETGDIKEDSTWIERLINKINPPGSPDKGLLDFESFKNRILEGMGGTSGPINANITVPESNVKVESTLNATLHLDGRVIARYVQRVLDRQMKMTTKSKTYSVPVGKV